VGVLELVELLVKPPVGAYAPTVTQHIPNGTVTTDRYGNKSTGFDNKQRQVVAEYPGDSLEVDNLGRDTVTADRIVLVPADWTVTTKDEWTLSDGVRYKASSVEPYRNPHTGTAITRVGCRRIS